MLTLNKAVFGTLPALNAGHACLLKSGAARGVLVTDVSPGLDTSTLAVPLSTSGKSSSSPSSSSASRHTFLPVEFVQTRTIHETLIKQQVEYSVQLLQVDILDECEQTLASERYDAGTSLLHVKELQGVRRLLFSVKQSDRSVSHLYFVRSNTLGSFEEQLVLFATTVLQWSQGIACPLKSKPIYALKAPAAASGLLVSFFFQSCLIPVFCFDARIVAVKHKLCILYGRPSSFWAWKPSMTLILKFKHSPVCPMSQT